MVPDRDYWWHELMASTSAECEAVELDAEHPLYILYTSGSTGKPKGVLHTTAGYLLGTMMTSQWVFDLKDDDTYWCTADMGWVTGHSYIVYGPLANGATVVMYEGAPNWPDEGRFWQLIEKYQVTILYTRPPRSAPSSSGATTGRRNTIFPACGYWVRSANRSIPKPGCGITG